jgi:hypothetical protein
MSNEQKPREFYLYDNGEVPMLAWPEEFQDDFESHGFDQKWCHHVIEFSAYEKLREDLRKLNELAGNVVVSEDW